MNNSDKIVSSNGKFFDYNKLYNYKRFISGHYVNFQIGNFNNTTISKSANVLNFYPIVVTEKLVINEIGVICTTLGVGVKCVAGLYSHNHLLNSSFEPKDLIVQSNELDMSTTGLKITSITATTLLPSIYWVATLLNGTCSMSAKSISSLINFGSYDTTNYNAQIKSYNKSLTYTTTLPSSLDISGTTNTTTAQEDVLFKVN